ncbi:hypothetical protein SAMN04487819_106186 [Actinopolyspora alba]|uniref:Uncharacterized protein n=1 Tax=Actinopolyspora alba TaxID=673379 RepID=A0A1I1WY99_9ACTN|nr:hypothetical protein SAMN04487819_106186 [Actinopolyspora alba]
MPPTPGVPHFRDPKVGRDTERGHWVVLVAEGNKIGFYARSISNVGLKPASSSRTDSGCWSAPICSGAEHISSPGLSDARLHGRSTRMEETSVDL